MQGEFVEDAERQHVHGHLNSQKLTGIGVPSGALYNVNDISDDIFMRVDGANITTLEVMINVVSRASGENFQIQTIRRHDQRKRRNDHAVPELPRSW